MAMPDREQAEAEPQAVRSSAAGLLGVPAGVLTDVRAISPRSVIALQRKAGNGAVVRLLSRQSAAAPTAPAVALEPDLSTSDYDNIVATLGEADAAFDATGLLSWFSNPDKTEIWLALSKLRRHPAAIAKLDAAFTKTFATSLDAFIKRNFVDAEREFTFQLINRGTAGSKYEIRSAPQTDPDIQNTAERIIGGLIADDAVVIFAALVPLGRNPVLIQRVASSFKSQVLTRKAQGRPGWKLRTDMRAEIAELNAHGYLNSYATYLLGQQTLQYGDAAAHKGASELLDDIKADAKARAKMPMSVDKASNFYKVLTDTYLKDYLANPTPDQGKKAAFEKIGRQLEGRTASDGSIEVRPEGGQWRKPTSYWETESITAFNNEATPDLPDAVKTNPLFKNLASLPKTMGAATEVLSQEKITRLPYLDVPFLVGKPNTDISSTTVDVTGGGKNISQLMHWATGVRYGDQPADAMRDLFVGYEEWHLEAWDVFGQDPINDLIAEEEGRQLGAELRKGSAGEIKGEADLIPFLNRSFKQARAWVGSLLALRASQLDAFITASEQPAMLFHWKESKKDYVWASPTIYQMLAAGMSNKEVKATSFYDSLVEIYALVYEAKDWEAAHGAISVTPLQKKLVLGELDPVLKMLGEGSEATTTDKAEGASNAKDIGQ